MRLRAAERPPGDGAGVTVPDTPGRTFRPGSSCFRLAARIRAGPWRIRPRPDGPGRRVGPR
ncbi:hypothetical protein EAO71_23685 [Streptomyces sp. ms191]|nr:hypothetical protein EAO71_23685 [Streptomyces sp. ms191]